MSETLLQMTGVHKDFQSLRPLRVRDLAVRTGDVLSIAGLDARAAETFVNLVTGATLADRGDVVLFGQNTRSIPDTGAWLRTLDGVGMVTARGVLIEAFSVLQNVAMSFTLEVDPIDPRVVPQAGALAREAGIDPGQFDLPAGRVAPDTRMRVHVARALALGPKLVIAEHASAALSRETVTAFGADLARAAQARGLALMAITADETFARAIGGSRLELVPATGELRTQGRLRRIFGA